MTKESRLTKIIGVRVTSSLYQALQAEATELRLPLRHLVRQVLAEHVLLQQRGTAKTQKIINKEREGFNE